MVEWGGRAARLYQKDGWTLERIGAEVGRSAQRVGQVLRERGVRTGPPPPTGVEGLLLYILECPPGTIGEIRRHRHLSPTRVRTMLEALVEQRLLRVKRSGGSGKGAAHYYVTPRGEAFLLMRGFG